MKMTRYALLAAVLGVAATTAHGLASKPTPDRVKTTDPTQALQAASAKAQDNDLAGAYLILKRLIASTEFAALNIELRHHALHLAGLCANETGDYAGALVYLAQSTAMPEATGSEWHARLSAAFQLGRIDEAALSLATIARQWPELLPALRDQVISDVLRQLRDQGKNAAWRDLANALFDGNWKILGTEPSWLWRALAERLLEEGKLDRAAAVAAAVDSPYDLIAMRVDLRFAGIVKANAALFDIDRALAAQISKAEAAAKQDPNSLEKLTVLTYALLSGSRYQEVLALSDQALARATPALGQLQPYSDANEYLIWIMDNRARALRGLGRYDEAVEQLERAARRPENGHVNVSNAINLGVIYCQLDRPDDALRAIEEVRDVSPYGRMQLEGVRQCAALGKGDAKTAQAAIAYLREHRKDAEGSYDEALLQANQLEAAAVLLIERLNSSEKRGKALLEIQDWVRPNGTPRGRELHRRWLQLLQRADVKAAIEKVGRIESQPLTPPIS